MKQIVPNDNCLTPEKILRYLQDETSPAEMRAIDRHIEQCPLCSDALEGLMHIPTAQLKTSFSSIQTKISHEIDKNLIEKPVMQVVHSTTKRYWLMGAAASFALFAIVGVWFFQPKTNENKAVAAAEPTIENTISSISIDTMASANYAVSDSKDTKTEDKAIEKVASKTASPSVSKPTNGFKITETQTNTVASAPSPTEYSLMRKLPPASAPEMEKDDVADSQKIAEETSKSKESKPALAAQAADMETQKGFDISNNPQLRNGEAIQNAVGSPANSAPNQSNYPGAATQNAAIPEVGRERAEYPSNAAKKAKSTAKPSQNYLVSGINFFNTKKYDLAIGDLNRLIAVEKSGENYETALWYLANAYLKKGDKTTAKKLLTRIVTEKSVFSTQAEGLLKE
jgi:anti-sigma factor RsiW